MKICYRLRVVGICFLFLLLNAALFSAPNAAEKSTHGLADFGPVATPAEAQATYEKAVQALRGKGGVLMVPANVWRLLKDVPRQGSVRKPEPPLETKTWEDGKGVTVMVLDDLQPTVRVPALAGLRLERPIRLADGDSLPHWGTHPAVTLESQLVYGSNSYLDWLQEPVKKGKDRRFYLATVRGLRPGQFLNLHGGPHYGGGVTRGCVKSLGYDVEKKMHYLVADTDLDHVTGAILHNKSNTGLLHMLQTSNNDNQTYDVKVIRKQYAHGDTYIYHCDFNYMSNVHSAAGDENGNCYAAFIHTLGNNFQGVVETVDWPQHRLKFGAASRNVETLGDSRPLVNRNPKKALTQGKVRIVAAESYTDAVDTGACRFSGKSYPSRLIKNPKTDVNELKMGGLIRGDKDCPWTDEIVGRYFAVADPTEKTPQGNLRWYQITSLTPNQDGTKDIEIRRYWWGAKSAGSPTLYRRDNYSRDGHDRPLEYMIAPGTYVNDVSRALAGGDRGGQQTVGLAPYRDRGMAFDFAAGDAIEQAIGPDPFRPQAFRVWMFEDVPGAFPSAVLDFANHGAASRYSAMTIGGGATTLAEAAKTQQQKPAWDNVIVLDSAAGVGLNCKADFADAAILFHQPSIEQPIKWRYGHQENKAAKEASLTVSRSTGELIFQGNGVRPNGPVTGATGLSGDAKPAQNLRGKNVPVEEKATTVQVRFPKPEADGNYAVFVEQTWLSNRAVTDKNAEGFTITFATAAPKNGKVDWFIVR